MCRIEAAYRRPFFLPGAFPGQRLQTPEPLLAMDGAPRRRDRLRGVDPGGSQTTGYPAGYPYRPDFDLYRADSDAEPGLAHGIGYHEKPAAAARR